jgi:hypothetical protein
MMEHLFTCCICGYDVRDYRFRKGRDKHIEPVCRGCEQNYGERTPIAGAFLDRRLAVQIAALANALNCEAHTLHWKRHGFSRLRVGAGV